MKTSLFSSILSLLLLVDNKLLVQHVTGERMEITKTETKVEIEVTYLYRQYDDNIRPTQKTIQFTYNIPNLSRTIASESRGAQRQPNIGNSNNNLRHGFRFEKGAGAFTMSTYENEGADNGLRVRNNPRHIGYLIHVVSLSEPFNVAANSSKLFWSHNACHEMVNSVQGNWVAMVQSGSCSTEQKLKQIMKLKNLPLCILIYGSSQVVIKQDTFVSINQEETPMVIFLPWSNIQGVVQKCFNSSGQITLSTERLNKLNRSLLDWPFNSQNQCNVTIRIVTTPDDNFLNKTSVLFVSISFILLMVISLAWLMFYYVQRFRYIHTKEQFSRRLAHMAKKAVAKIPVKTIKQGDKETDAEVENCAICIECYKPPDTVRILPCKHYFHKSCIDPWLLEQRSCPMCKLNILHAYGFLPNERGSIISEDRLSELDSSLELQFVSGSAISQYPGVSTRIQAHCQARDSIIGDIVIDTTSTISIIPPIPTESNSQGHNKWTSLRLMRPFCSTHRIDRSVSMRQLSSSAEERTTFLPQNRPLSQSATNNAVDHTLSPSPYNDGSTSSSSYSSVVPDVTKVTQNQ